MCGIVGIHCSENTNQIIYEIFEGLMALQHRGQDSVGIATTNRTVKRPGLVKYAFQHDDLTPLKDQMAIGHVRYATNGVADNIQPLYKSIPTRITLCHNGNIINVSEIKAILQDKYRITLNTESDSELLLVLFSAKLHELLCNTEKDTKINSQMIHEVSAYLHEVLHGSFCLLIMIQDYGLIAIRDKFGIRPFVWGKKDNKYIVASESVCLNLLNYSTLRDVRPGETIVFENEGRDPVFYQYKETHLRPCLFEYIYFARADSAIEDISVHHARILIGQLLGKKMLKKWDCSQIDVIVPVPDTSITFANGIQDIIHKPLREGYIKNRYIDRTFIMENNKMIQQNIKRKLSGIEHVFKNKNVLIVDDSIVRGNTSKHIIQIARSYGAKTIYFASCAPVVKETNQYGIYIPTREELVSFERTEEQIRELINVDYLIYNDLDKITEELKTLNCQIDGFETSMF